MKPVLQDEHSPAHSNHDSTASERLRTEHALRSSEARFRMLVDNIRDHAIFMLGPSGEVTSWNQGATRILGYQPRDVVSLHLGIFFTEEDRQLGLAAEHLRLAERFGQFEDEGWRVRDNGERFWAHTVITTLYDDKGVIGFSIVMRDLTERRLAEQAIQRRTEQLANVVNMQQRIGATALQIGPGMEQVIEEVGALIHADGTAIGIVDNGHLNFRMASGIVAEVRGMRVPREGSPAGIALSTGDWFRSDDCQNDPRCNRELAQRYGVGSLLAVPLLYDGRGIGVLVVVYAAKNAIAASDLATLELLAGQLAAAVTNAVSIEANEALVAARTAALAKIHEREERFRSLIENATDCITIVDVDLVIQYASPSHFRVLGYRPEEMEQRSMLEFVHPDDAPAMEKAVHKLVADGADKFTMDLRKLHRFGSWRSMISVFKNLVHEPGVLGIVLTCRDVSEQNALEAQLRQSQKMDAVGQLAGGVAHDFNNLLTVIKGNVQLLRDDLERGFKPDEEIDEIRKAADRAAGLTKQLLAFSRKQLLHPRVVNLNEIVQEIEPMLRRLIGEDVTVRTTLAASLPPVLADPGQLQQILVNLSVNARDAMSGGGVLTIATSVLDVNAAYSGKRAGVEIPVGSYVQLSVKDTGTGMSQDVRDRVFEPFFTTKEAGKGTGLGLATVYGIVRQSNGFIWVDSDLGKGTTFEIVLPCANVATALKEEIEEEDPHLNGSETILLVEDEEPLRLLAMRVLQRHGYHVLHASNGLEALEIASQFKGRLDLVITDVVMPEMGGRGLSERLALIRSDAKLLYMSGYTDDEIIRRGLLDPRLALLEKPFSPRDLARTVRRVLDDNFVAPRRS